MATDEQPPLPPLPPPKYGLLKSQPLNYQRENNPPAAEKTKQEENDLSPTPANTRQPDSTIPSRQNRQGEQKQQYQAPTGYAILGNDLQTNEPVMVTQAARRQGLYTIGIQGTGKSGLIENLIIQDIKQGLGVGLLDPHGDLTHAVLARMPDRRVKDVIYLDLAEYRYPFGINLFTCADPSDPGAVSEAASKVMHIFKKLWGKGGIVVEDAWGVLLEEILWNTTLTFLEASKDTVYTMAEIPMLLGDSTFRNRVVNHLTNRHVKNYWLRKYNPLSEKDQRDETRSTLNRVNAFLTQPIVEYIVGQAQNTIDFRSIMDERKILLIKLSKRHEAVTALIGSMVIAELLNAAYSRTENKRKQFNLYADEFQNFATEDFATLLEEARKFGIGIAIAHQNRGQLDAVLKDRIRSVANLVVFKVNSKDADELAGEFDITPQEARVEVLEEERIETMEVIDGEEPIKAISQNPVNFILSATHMNEQVRKARATLLSPLKLALEMVDRDGFWYFEKRKYDNCMGVSRGQLQHSLSRINDLLVDMMERRIAFGSDAMLEKITDILLSLRGYLGLETSVYYISSEYSSSHYEQEPHQETRSYLFAFVHEYYDLLNRQSQYQSPGEEFNLQSKNDEITMLVFTAGITGQVSREGLINYCLQQRSINDSIKAKREELSQAVKKLFFAFYQLLNLCSTLQVEPILVDSGQTQPRKRQQIVVRPEKTLTHPQRSYADMLNEVASELVNLPVYTARVRITTEAGLIEHMVKMLDPKQQSAKSDRTLFGQTLEERLDSIKDQNIKDGYVRERSEVEAEIIQRQEHYSEPPEEPPISRRPPR